MIVTVGGGDGPWKGIPSTAKQKLQHRYALYTRVDKSKIPGAGLELFMLEDDAATGDPVTVHSGTPLTAVEAAMSQSRYLFEVNKNLFLDAENLIRAMRQQWHQGWEWPRTVTSMSTVTDTNNSEYDYRYGHER